jgi:hypothetical protein
VLSMISKYFAIGFCMWTLKNSELYADCTQKSNLINSYAIGYVSRKLHFSALSLLIPLYKEIFAIFSTVSESS